MFIKLFFLSALCLFVNASMGFATTYKLVPLKMAEQHEWLRQGQTLWVSGKHNPVSVCSTEKVMKNGKGTFFISCSNNAEFPINLYFQNVSITDQWGRPIRLIHKEELIEKKKSQTRWAQFASALCTGLDACSAQNAGDIHFQSNTSETYRVNQSNHGANGWNNNHGSMHGSSSTSGTIHCEALKRQALEQVTRDGQARKALITNEYENYESSYNHHYFDSNTLLPQTCYESFFHIAIPKDIEKNLEYLFVNVDLGGERHTFCFYCAHPKKNCRR